MTVTLFKTKRDGENISEMLITDNSRSLHVVSTFALSLSEASTSIQGRGIVPTSTGWRFEPARAQPEPACTF